MDANSDLSKLVKESKALWSKLEFPTGDIATCSIPHTLFQNAILASKNAGEYRAEVKEGDVLFADLVAQYLVDALPACIVSPSTYTIRRPFCSSISAYSVIS